ncbi:helix-turn-helix transcriptional regulator, partial [Streptomyces monomycini]|uniref:helix-turn-helix transcriptional regulator n=1 Tax=Streptomyces monomycini TaxID=371720 RepID=UPI0012FED2DE
GGGGGGGRPRPRLFRAELGMTFPQWRTQLRLHHALVLLTQDGPALSVTAIAHRCGWASASAFIDAFRGSFGHTPGAHRALMGPATTPATAAARTRSRRRRSASP